MVLQFKYENIQTLFVIFYRNKRNHKIIRITKLISDYGYVLLELSFIVSLYKQI